MIKIAHLGDLHASAEHAHRFHRSAEHVKQKLHEENPDLIVIAGDVWDSVQSLSNEGAFLQVAEFLNFLSFLAPVVIVKGNDEHDAPGSIDILNKLEKNNQIIATENPLSLAFFKRDNDNDATMVVLDDIGEFEELKEKRPDVLIHLMPYPTKSFLLGRHFQVENRAASKEEEDEICRMAFRSLFTSMNACSRQFGESRVPAVLVGHGNVENAMMSNLQTVVSNDVIIQREDLQLGGFQYVAFGHIHKPQEFYSGSFFSVDYGETEKKSFKIAEIQDDVDLIAVVREIEIPTTPRATVLCDVLENDGQFGIRFKESFSAERFAGCEVKFRIEMTPEQREAFTTDAIVSLIERDFSFLADFAVERITIEKERVRSHDIATKSTLWEQFVEWLRVNDAVESNEKDFPFLKRRCDELEASLSNGTTDSDFVPGAGYGTPTHLSLKGAIGIQDGLGIDRVEIPFEKFSPGLVALVGQNGSGKTTLIENMQPFAVMPSHPGALQNNFSGDGHKDLTWKTGEHTFRAYVTMSGSSAKGYFYKDGNPVNPDGKISSFKDAIQKYVGNEELFFRSIFASQKMPSFANTTVTQRKQLFSELLGFQRYEVLLDLAKDMNEGTVRTRDEIKTKLDALRLDETRDLLKMIDDVVPVLESEKRNLESSEITIDGDIAAGQRHLQDITSELAVAKSNDAQFESSVSVLRNIVKEKSETTKNLSDEINGIDKRIEHVENELNFNRSIVENYSNIDERLRELEELRQTSVSDDTAQHGKDLVEKERREMLDTFHRDKQKLRDKIDEQTNIISGLEKQKSGFLEKVGSSIVQLQGEENILVKLIDEAKRQRAFLSSLPCHGIKNGDIFAPYQSSAPSDTLMNTSCSLLSDAHAKVSRLQEHETELARVRKEIEDLLLKKSSELSVMESGIQKQNDEKTRLKTELDMLFSESYEQQIGKEFDVKLEPFLETIKKANDALVRVREIESEKLSEKKELVEVAKSKITGYESELTTMAAERESAIIELGKITGALLNAQKDVEEKEQGNIQNMNRILALGTQLTEQETKISSLNSEIAGVRNRIKELVAKLAEYETKKKSLTDDLSRGADLENELTETTSVIMKHDLIIRSLGKEGIPALQLDAASPEISRITNELLSVCFGTDFRITIETQRLTADKKKNVEDFDVSVDHRGRKKVLDDLSGGQRVWVERALSFAFAIYMTTTSDRKYGVAFMDETDGALDAESKHLFLSMLRRAHELSRRSYTFVITHTEAVWRQIAQRIHFERGEGLRLVF